MNYRQPTFDRVLAECLESVLTGEASLNDCLERYPQYADELAQLIPLANSLREAPKAEPSLNFRLRSRQRLVANLPDRSPAVTFWQRIRTYLVNPLPKRTQARRRTTMTWLLIGSLVFAMLGGGGVGVAYAADGASPGETLYGVDQALEATQMALTFDEGARAELALAFAQERVMEVQTLANQGASEAAIAEAAAGYQAEIQSAAQALAAVAASGDDARAQALSELLTSALAVHEGVLAEVAGLVPAQAAPAIEGAITSAQIGRSTVEQTFQQGIPGSAPEIEAGGPPEDNPAGPPEGAGPPEDAGPPQDSPGAGPQGEANAGEAAPSQNVEDRIAGLDENIANAAAHADNGDYEAARVELQQYENEVDSLAQGLASVATEDEARAEALAAMLDEALSRHSEVLNQLAEQVPAQAREFIQPAIDSSAAGKEAVDGIFANGIPGGAPSDVPGAGAGGNGP